MEYTTVEQIFFDIHGRRSAIIKAFTTDFKKFYDKCDPDAENLCLHAFPNGTWEVDLPGPLPAKLPEPVLGINYARDGMTRKEWLTLLANHSDAWLISVAFFFCAHYRCDKAQRYKLFGMINNLPSISEVVSGSANKQPKKKSLVSTNSSHKSKIISKDASGSAQNWTDSDDDICGACEELYGPDEFWICCDICDRWYHGECVEVTPARAKKMKVYKCPSCGNN